MMVRVGFKFDNKKHRLHQRVEGNAAYNGLCVKRVRHVASTMPLVHISHWQTPGAPDPVGRG